MSDKETTIDAQIARMHLIRELRPYRERATALVMVVILPNDDGASYWQTAAYELLKHMPVADIEKSGEDEEYNWRAAVRGDFAADTFGVDKDDKKKAKDPWLTVSFGNKRTVLICKRPDAQAVLESRTSALADVVADIREFDLALVQRAVKDATDSDITREEAAELLTLPPDIRTSLRKTGRGIQSVLQRIREFAAVKPEEVDAPPRKSDDGPRLEELHGYGPAMEWAMELQRDMADYEAGRIPWADVDNGVLLSGPPGCGKTTFAAALAKSLGAQLVVGSYSVWLGQGEGHQGTMLKAMRRAFDDARKNAPAVLLIDEIDNFPQRGSIDGGRGDDWNRGVVNGLLECLDGAVEREGVIVVGATNDATNIDSAIRRPGRLNRHIEIPLPDAGARKKILQYHLQSNLDVSPIIGRTEGMSGADLEGVAKDARRAARRNGGVVTLEMVVDALPEMVPISFERRKRIAIHELGHAVVAVALRHTVLEKVVVNSAMFPTAMIQSGGYTRLSIDIFATKDSDWWKREICVLVGSVAAETMVYGAHADGVSHDLQQATNAATHMTAVAGMGRSLSSEGPRADLVYQRARNYGIDREIDDILHEQFLRASQIVEQHRDLFERLAGELADKGELSGEYVTDAVNRHNRPVQLSLAV
ncbi:AAA family ATPase [Rhizobium sp. CB3060]|uniref:AAA family ATPase n=1 Tax=Rhizobium sp. CB3060 TaxID=3138255 RepID=UPI0021A76D74|nr:AAA family ATPase [Rhizobium tropici]UWU23002.1 AAA family ATPase [Rhizobium tropici]